MDKSRSLLFRALACLAIIYATGTMGLRAEAAFSGTAKLKKTTVMPAPLSAYDTSACTNGTIQCGSSKDGQLATDDCVLPDKMYIDYYTFQGTAGYTVTIDMGSTSLDTYLFLFDPSGQFARGNDDTATTNSQLTFRLTTSGIWTIGATSAREYETGNYSLALQCADLGLPNLTPYRPSAWSDRIIISNVQNATADSTPLRSGTPLYLRWAVINSGPAAVDRFTTVYVEVAVDGVVRTRGIVEQDWPAGQGFTWASYNTGSLPVGTHSVRIRADSTNVVQESNEADNDYTKVFEVVAPPPPPPVVSFTFSPITPTINQPIQFAESSTGSPTSWLWDFGDGSSAFERNPVHSYAASGTYAVQLRATNAGGSGSTSRSVSVVNPPPCAAGLTKLCLNNNRFGAQVAWNARGRGGGSGSASAVRLTADTGFFWFFSPNNVELVVKVVDGRPVNGRYWVFYGAMSDVEYTVTVTDSSTGRIRTYFNPSGTLGSVADTEAFAPAADPGTALLEEANLSGSIEMTGTVGENKPDNAPEVLNDSSVWLSCFATGTNLCLNGRFAVEVSWTSAIGSGVGNAIPLTSDTGYFWFFSANNLELAIKIVDGRSFNGFFWAFYGALSDVEYTITVVDTLTGSRKMYANPQGRLASVADVVAFR